MSEKDRTPLKSKRGDRGTVAQGSAREGIATKEQNLKSEGPKAPISSAKTVKMASINLTPVESQMFFNIVRFNNNPSNVDWDKVAEHCRLMNASTARVRFRQIQKKYGLEPTPMGHPMKRKAPVAAAAALDDDDADDVDDVDEESDDPEVAPPKKRLNRSGTHGSAFKRPASKKIATTQDESESETTALAVSAVDSPTTDTIATSQKDQDVKQVQGQSGSAIKQVPHTSQASINDVRPGALYDPHPQQQCSHSQLPSPLTFDSVPYNEVPTQFSGLDMMQNIHPFQHVSSMPIPHQSYGMSQQQQQQQAHLQNLQLQQQQEWGGFSSPYNQSVSQFHDQNYMMLPGGGQYARYPLLPPHHAQPLDGYFGAQRLVQMPGLGMNFAHNNTAPELASQSEANQGRVAKLANGFDPRRDAEEDNVNDIKQEKP